MKLERKVTIIEPTLTMATSANNFTPQKLRVAAYARVSTEQDEQQSSYAAQVVFYTQHIKSNPEWDFVGVFSDEGITGTSMKNRDGFNLMLKKALDGEIDLILTKSISRFARNTVDTLKTVRELKSKGVEVVFEKENIHTFDPKCEVMLTIMSSLAQEESRSISENVRWGKRKSMMAGNVTMAYARFLGYEKGEDGQPQIVEEEAVIIRQIYQMFLDDKSIRNIADYLTEQKIPTPSGKTKWSVSTIKSILTNEKYKGDALLQKTYTVDYLTKEVRKNNGEMFQYLVRDSHPAIIEPEVFDQVQEKMEKHCANKNKNHSKSPFANCIVCADCGHFYGHKVWHNRNNTERYDVWYCNHKYTNSQNCQTPYLREEEIKEAFSSAIKQKEGSEVAYTEVLWRESVEKVVVYPDSSKKFLFKDGMEITVQ